MTLTDTGPLVALLDRRDHAHRACAAAAVHLPGPLLTTWPCFTEAMHLLGSAGGHAYQSELWRLYRTGRVVIRNLPSADVERMDELMEKYADTPMDLADSSLVATAEA